MKVTFRPLAQWPRKLKTDRKAARFDSAYKQTLHLLDRELQKIGATNVVVQLALSERYIRNDGMPYVNSRPEHPGVIVSFEKDGRAISMPCDTYTYWEDNLRAIAVSLEALRAVDRHGVTESGEQYQGWAQLPAPSTTLEERGEAALFFYQHSGVSVTAVETKLEVLERARREALKKVHPDVEGGSNDLFIKCQHYYNILREGAV